MEDNRVVPINKNKEPEIDSIGFMAKTIDSFPVLERDILRLSLGLGEPYEIMHSSDEIAEILNKPKELIDKNLAMGMSRLGKIHLQEKEKQENENAYSEIRLQIDFNRGEELKNRQNLFKKQTLKIGYPWLKNNEVINNNGNFSNSKCNKNLKKVAYLIFGRSKSSFE